MDAQPALSRIPRDVPRFEIDSVTDSTAIFRVQEARWLRAGMTGYAVDPRQRDALVARVKIMASDTATAVAQVTSQVSLVKRDHVLLILAPERPWWRRRTFWVGLGTGIVVGGGTALLAKSGGHGETAVVLPSTP
ncbi:hypothetical protein [Gemmatimonas aurantiaca]|uniref:hypothetical protein n=1 Tax=Gemmatimonas aurantiaca TaxID=173480 RepID=UPI00301B7B29